MRQPFISLFSYVQATTAACAEVEIAMPRDGVIVGAMMSLFIQPSSTDGAFLWIAPTKLGFNGWIVGAPVLALITFACTTLTAVGQPTTSQNIYVPLRHKVSFGSKMVVAVQAGTATATGYVTLQLEQC